MEKGSLVDNGARWQKKEIKKGFIDTGGEIVVAYRCPKCKKVELVTE